MVDGKSTAFKEQLSLTPIHPRRQEKNEIQKGSMSLFEQPTLFGRPFGTWWIG
jgi:hypothetical protein